MSILVHISFFDNLDMKVVTVGKEKEGGVWLELAYLASMMGLHLFSASFTRETDMRTRGGPKVRRWWVVTGDMAAELRHVRNS